MDSTPSFRVFEPPAFASPDEVQSSPYRREPYVRAHLPEEVVDGKVTRWSSTHVLVSWVPAPGVGPRSALVPAGWVSRIEREQSAWRDPYDLH